MTIETQRTLSGAALPVHADYLFIADLAAFSAIKDPGGFIDSTLVLADFVRA